MIVGSILKAIFNNPVIKPQAINAGISGIKILEMRFNNNLKGVAFFCGFVDEVLRHCQIVYVRYL